MCGLVRHMKRVLGIGTRTRPVLMSNVTASPQDPATAAIAQAAQTALVQEVMRAERKGWEVRQALASGVLDIVVSGDHRRSR